MTLEERLFAALYASAGSAFIALILAVAGLVLVA